MDYDAAIAAVRDALAAFRESGDWPGAPPEGEVRQICEVLRRRVFDRGLTVREVLLAVGVRDHNAQTRFRAAVGLSIWELVTRRRIEAAEHVLVMTDAPVYLVGQAVGYAHPETFSRVFRARRGMPPQAFRRARRNEQRSGGRRRMVNVASGLGA